MRILGTIIVFSVGWLLGDHFGVPEPVRALVGQGIGAVGGLIPSADDSEATTESASAANTSTKTQANADTAPKAIVATAAPSGPWTAEKAMANMAVCGGMSIANRPTTRSDGTLRGLPARVNLSGVPVATVPVMDACFSSGYGNRNGRLHKGVDFHNPNGATIYAAARGTVVEAEYRDDYGNMIVIDHGNGAYTRYAHLARMNVRVGTRVDAGSRIGQMGNTAGYRIPVHLHFEMLSGEYGAQAKSFSLTPRNPFVLPSA